MKIYKNDKGQYHREDGPAVIDSDGYKAWYKNGQLHREDGPAIIRPNGSKEWYINGKLHREDGPAIMDDPKSYYVWFKHGVKHRAVQPALIKKSYRAWVYDGIVMSDKVTAWLGTHKIDIDNISDEDAEVLTFHMMLWANETHSK